MISIALLEKSGCETFISRGEVRSMIADSSKPNLDHKKHGEERHHPKTETTTISKSKPLHLSLILEETNPFAIER